MIRVAEAEETILRAMLEAMGGHDRELSVAGLERALSSAGFALLALALSRDEDGGPIATRETLATAWIRVLDLVLPATDAERLCTNCDRPFLPDPPERRWCDPCARAGKAMVAMELDGSA